MDFVCNFWWYKILSRMKNAKIQLDKKFTILDRDAERCVGIKLFFL